MSEAIAMQKGSIDPIDCYRQAFELVKGRYGLLLGVSAAGMLIGGAVPIALIGPMMCGVYLCFLEAYSGREFQFGLLFERFDELFVPSLIASLVMTGISVLVLAPAFIVAFAGMLVSIPSGRAEGWQAATPAFFSLGTGLVVLLLSIALIMAVGMFFMFAFPLIVDRKLNGTDAIGVSARAVAGNFPGMLGLTLINTLLGLAGLLACYVGTFFVLPISFAAMTIAYRKVFPEIVAEAGGDGAKPAGNATA